MSQTDQLVPRSNLALPPGRRVAVLARLDTRLSPHAVLGLREGDAHVIRNVGGIVDDAAIRSLAISQNLYETEEIIVLDLDGDVRAGVEKIKASPVPAPRRQGQGVPLRGRVGGAARGRLSEAPGRCRAGSYDPAMQIDGLRSTPPRRRSATSCGPGWRRTPDAVAVTSATRSLTWAELEEESARLAGGYRGLGLEPGDRLASLMPNRIDLVVHYLACFKAGLVATPLNYRYTAPRDRPRADGQRRPRAARPRRAGRGRRRQRAGRWARAGDDRLRRRRAAERRRRGGGAGAHEFAALLAAEPLAAPAEPPTPPTRRRSSSPPAAPARPRASPTADESLRWMIASAAAAFGLERRGHLPARLLDVAHRLLPLGAERALGRRPRGRRPDHRQPRDPAAAARAAADRDGDDPGRALGSDSRPRPAAARLRLAADLPRRLRQGLDRAAARVRRRRRLPDRRGLRDDRGRPGDPEPALRGDQTGLDRDPDRRLQHRLSATRTASRSGRRRWAGSGSAPAARWSATGRRPRRPPRWCVDGWLDSGDLARADEDGYLWFFGRKKQVIVHDGSNISPYEVEGALVEHPAIALAGAVGVHDDVHGENVRAYVTLRRGRRAAHPRRPDRPLPRARRLQGPGGDRLPRRDAAQPDRQDRPRRPEADGRRPPAPARARVRFAPTALAASAALADRCWRRRGQVRPGRARG